MRVIFEEVENELFFEVILSTRDIEHFQQFNGIVGDFVWDIGGIREMNVFIRKEKECEEKGMVKKREEKKILPTKKISGKCACDGLKNGTKGKRLAN